jgi:hypothetical protein
MAKSHKENRSLLRPFAGIVGAMLSFYSAPILTLAQDQIGVVALADLTCSACRPGPVPEATPDAAKAAPLIMRSADQKASFPQPTLTTRSGERSNTAPFQKFISAPALSGASHAQIPNRSMINGTGITHPGSGPGTVTGSAKPGAAINGALIHRAH